MGRRREDRYAGHKDLPVSAKEPGVAIEHVSSDVALAQPAAKAVRAVDDDDEGRIRRHDWVPVKEEQGVSARSPIRQHRSGDALTDYLLVPQKANLHLSFFWRKIYYANAPKCSPEGIASESLDQFGGFLSPA